MPLLDLFHPPLNRRRHWESLHSAWANALTEHLNHGLLPAGYFAEPHVKVSARVEIDVATFEVEPGTRSGGNGAVAVWAPPRPLLDLPLSFQGLDLFEVQVVREEEGPRVVAAIELISPANKDRPQHRRAFATKCAAYLQQGITVMMVDVVTSRGGNLQRELLEMLSVAQEGVGPMPDALYAAALRTFPGVESLRLQVWAEPLTVGATLPTMPLWISVDRCLPVNLEATYVAACHTLLLP